MIEPAAPMDRLRAFVLEHTPSLTRGPAALAVSGGGDSVAMASLLLEAGLAPPDTSVVGYFDHRIRGPEDAAAERDAVAALCARYGVEMAIGTWDAPQRSEAAARDARYRFLAEVARSRRIGVIATAHTADDQVETIIMHSMRGAGDWGLRGIAAEAPVHSDASLVVARPLLTCSRAELRAWCAARRLTYVDDPSNGDLRFLRNRIRHQTLPRMEAATPGVRERILALAADAAARIEALAPAAAPLRRAPHPELTTPHIVLDRQPLREAPPDIATHAYRNAVTSLLGNARDFGRAHYDTMVRAASAVTGAMYELPRGIVVTVDPHELIVSLGPLVLAPVDTGVLHAPPFTGQFGAWWLDVRPTECGAAVPGCDRHAATARSATLTLPNGAVIRARRPGDRVRLPAGGTKKLQDLYVDAKVPRRERDAAPVIAIGGTVLWTPLTERRLCAGTGGPQIVTWRRATP